MEVQFSVAVSMTLVVERVVGKFVVAVGTGRNRNSEGDFLEAKLTVKNFLGSSWSNHVGLVHVGPIHFEPIHFGPIHFE